MKKKVITLILIATVLAVTMTAFAGCFLQNLSIISGKMSEEVTSSLDMGNQELVTEDGDIVFTNFSQTNRAALTMGENEATMVSEYKMTDTMFYMHSYMTDKQSASSQDFEVYIEKDGDYYFVYMRNPNNKSEWKVGAIDKATLKSYLTQKDSSMKEDSRINLFNAKNYKSSGDHYKYVGPKVVLMTEEESGMATIVLKVNGLYTIENGIRIEGKADYDLTEEQKEQAKAAGYSPELNLPYTYTIFNVGTTTITLPSVINSEYKQQYKNSHSAN